MIYHLIARLLYSARRLPQEDDVLNDHLSTAQPIKSIRQELGLTQQDFAAKLGVALPTISRWENEVHKPSPLALDKVSSFLRTLGDRGVRMIEKHGIGAERGLT